MTPMIPPAPFAHFSRMPAPAQASDPVAVEIPITSFEAWTRSTYAGRSKAAARAAAVMRARLEAYARWTPSLRRRMEAGHPSLSANNVNEQ